MSKKRRREHSSRESGDAGTGAPTIGLLAALVVITLVVFAPVRHFDFVSIDDAIYVTGNSLIRGGLTWSAAASTFTSTYANFWHPLTMLSLMVDVHLFGMNPGALHCTNLLLHLGSTLLLFLALLRMTGAAGPSAFVAALFAVHPLHVESVAWIAERKDVLSTFFWMLTLWAYVRYVRVPTPARYGLVVVSFALGLMAKPMLVMLPFTLLLLDVWPLGRISLSAADPTHPRRRPIPSRAWLPLVREKVPLFVLAVAASLAAFLAQQRGGAVATLDSFPVTIRVPNALVASVTYVLKMVWPRVLVAFYPYPQVAQVWQALAALAVLVGVSVLVVAFAPRRPSLAVGWFWYLLTLLPVSGLVQVGSHAMADRYTYVPLIGLFIMVAWGVPEAVGTGRLKRIILAAGAAAVIVACGTVARAQVMTWQNSPALWEHTLRVMPDNYYAHNALGLELKKQGRASEAAAHFLRSAELAPGLPNANNNLGRLQAEQGRTAEAIEQFREALRRQPDYLPACVNLGDSLMAAGRLEEAVRQYQEALRLGGSSADTRMNLGSALLSLGRPTEAVEQLREAVRLQPDHAEAHMNLGTALFDMNRLEEALREHAEAVRLDPGSANARFNLASTLQRMGRFADAAAQYRETLRLEGASPEVHLALGTVLEQLGLVREAAAQYVEALRLKPDSADARAGLTRTLAAPKRRRP
jgi:tetratricopeptide (TPR) repeat protein